MILKFSSRKSLSLLAFVFCQSIILLQPVPVAAQTQVQSKAQQIATYRVREGFYQENRQNLLKSIKVMSASGENVDDLINEFFEFENRISDKMDKAKFEQDWPTFLAKAVKRMNDHNTYVGSQRLAAKTALQNKQIDNAMRTYYPPAGACYKERFEIWNQIKTRHAAGQDVSMEVSYLAAIDKILKQKDGPEIQRQCAALQQILNRTARH